jgi:peptidoglycan/xylan/chitin deacetylase (PgdA/CDA1 family)
MNTSSGQAARRIQRVLGVAALLASAACATPAPVSPPPAPTVPVPRVEAPPPAAPAPEAPLPAVFESPDFFVIFARPGDTHASLAERHLGDASRAWMIEDYTGKQSFAPGEEVVIPRRPWNPSGVTPEGYQIVPVLVYHNIGPEQKGRMQIAASRFEQQMRYLKERGYRVISMRDFLEFSEGTRQVPRRAVVLSFDDGYRSFREFAEPVLRQLGFTATLFVYTDYVGAGRNALSWKDLRELRDAGFDVEAHSKTHGDLRRKPGESAAAYGARMREELGVPQALFRQHLGNPATILAYPYGAWDDDVLKQLEEYGYAAAFTVRRESNSAFMTRQKLHRSQVYGEMGIEEFARNLNVTHDEPLK